ncbi:MAG: ABC transporter substrate-binding protein [Deltaproteobacteria bacterium]|nr:ABC transporter substrate-binding protein [Deltaproteobacteria bacterium]
MNVIRAGLAAAAVVFGLLAGGASAAEKVVVATAVRQSPVYYLPVMACLEKGFCQKQGINVEWVPFGSATSMYQAVAAGSVKMGLTHVGSQLQVATRGLPVVVVSDLKSSDDFSIWVKSKGGYHSAADLKGAKLGVSRFGGVEHAYGRVIARAAGREREIRFISTGGIPESLASLKTGAIDGVVLSPHQMIKLKEAGEVREIAAIGDYLPKPWMGYVIFAERGFVKGSLPILKRTLHGLLDSIRFIRSNAEWTVERMKNESGYSDSGARLIYEKLRLTTDGIIRKEAAENARRVLLEYGIIGKEAPPAGEIYTMEALKPS